MRGGVWGHSATSVIIDGNEGPSALRHLGAIRDHQWQSAPASPWASTQRFVQADGKLPSPLHLLPLPPSEPMRSVTTKRVVISGHQWSSVVIRTKALGDYETSGHQWSSVVIRGYQWSSVVIRAKALGDYETSGHHRRIIRASSLANHLIVIRLTSCPRMRHSLACSASETVPETAPSRVALADLHVHASAIRKRFASIEMSEHLMREAIRCHQRPSQKDAPFGLNGFGKFLIANLA